MKVRHDYDSHCAMLIGMLGSGVATAATIAMGARLGGVLDLALPVNRPELRFLRGLIVRVLSGVDVPFCGA